MSVSTTPPSAASVINSTEDAALSFNISFSVNLGSLMQLPSRILARLRKLDALLDPDAGGRMGAGATGNVGNGSLMRRIRPDRPPPPPGLTPMPGPWAFFASGYAIALFAMALLLNRIQHIVAPSRQPLAYRLRFDGAHGYRSRLSFTRSIYAFLFPIDLSSTFARTLFRVPTLYLLSKALALWFIILLQTSGFFPSFQWDWLQSIGTWAARKEMEDVCWSTFGAVCSALCVGALTRGLEGVGGNNTSPFNLFGYAFLLHLYSSPITHSEKQEGLPSRPDMHVVVTILMPLLQLWMVHLLGVKQSWSNQRLIPTTICSVLTLIHFHSVLWLSPASYPLLNYMSCIFESLLILVTLLAFA
ncbi:hypothetical protein EWM64_g10938 [Hericium alpestre]|uniref:Uncharacterized protein n=1 Tax=Hericium alpestre TaxID=135208 RepID=A0A4Y9ZF30_9AGAM|nr:hypothetical protein EWM64_g10938 [Hericium alpestre]